MEIKTAAKNGVATLIIKSLGELTEQERAALAIPATDTTDDYANYAVHYNKKNELIRVVAHDFSDAKSAQIKEESAKPDIIDASKLMYGTPEQRQQAIAKYKAAGIQVPSESQLKALLGE